MKELILKHIGMDIHQGRQVLSSQIPFAAHVAEYCKMNSCGRYNKSWTCPPGAGDYLSLKEKYLGFKNAFVVNAVYKLEDCFDLEGMNEGREKTNKLGYKTIKEMKKVNNKVGMLLAGSCEICSECTYPHAPCRHEEWAFPSIEACGIDVMALAKKFDMTYYGGENTVTYFMIFFYN